MTNSLQQSKKNKMVLLYLIAALLLVAGCKKSDNFPAPVLKIVTFTTGLAGPIGLEIDKYGNVWVAQSGSGKNDGKVSIIKPNGQKYDAIINLESIITKIGEIEGPSHLLLKDGILYILGASGKMYKAAVTGFKPGDAAINGGSLATEDIGAFVLAHNFVNDAHDTHPYNITTGPEGAFYIADAAANAIIKRANNGVLSVFAEVPGIANPLPFGPPQIQSVPTGIIFDGQNFLITTLLGFPFPEGKAIVYKISKQGSVSIYQQGFTTLVDIAPGEFCSQMIVEHGIFGNTGFTPNTGKLIAINSTTSKIIAEGLNLPVGIKQANQHTWYVTSLGDGSILKITC